MLARASFVVIGISMISIFGVVSCGELGIPGQNRVVSSATTQPPGQGAGTIVAVTPLPFPEPLVQPPGSSNPGGATGGAGGQAGPDPQSETPQSGNMLVYSDNNYKFSVEYPADYVIRVEPAQKLNQLVPVPLAAFRFMNPVLAASTVPDEPADLEIRVYSAEQATLLDEWLTSNGLTMAGASLPPKPFHTAYVSGVQVCPETMIAPGCSFFVMGGGWVYQLIATSITGESMINSFRLIP